MYYTDFHGDDYGISPNNSKRMLSLVREGHLNSFSIIPNMSCYDECIKILKEEWSTLPQKPLISVHINLIGGLNISGTGKQFPSWGQILIKSLIPGASRSLIKRQITDEIKTQITRVYNDIKDLPGVNPVIIDSPIVDSINASSPSNIKEGNISIIYPNVSLITKGDKDSRPATLRLDSHVHTHMIPMVFDAMLDAVKEAGLSDKLDYVRISHEPFIMFLKTPGVKGTFPLINVIKNWILTIFSIGAVKKLKRLNISYGMLWGLIMSGKMDTDRMKALMPQMTAYASSKNKYLEILGHPGIVLKEEELPEFGPDDKTAFFSENRNVEYEAMVNCCRY